MYFLRCYARLKGRLWGLDDFLLSAALIFSVLVCFSSYYFVKLSYMGYPLDQMPPRADIDVVAVDYYAYLFELFYNPVLALVKASVLVLLLRLGGHKRSIRWAIHLLNATNAMLAIAIFLVTLFKCIPIDAVWEPTVKGRCVNTIYYLITAVLTVVTDILVLALPFWIFLGLQMKTKVKMAVIGIFTLGVGVTVVSIVRVGQLVDLSYFPAEENRYFSHIGPFLGTIEANLAIANACLPALRPLLKGWVPGMFSSGKSNAYGYKGGISSARLHPIGSHISQARGGNSYGIPLKSFSSSRQAHTMCRSISPTGSEQEIVTSIGIMRKMDVQVQFDHSKGRDSFSQRSSDRDPLPEHEPKGLA